MFDPKFTISDDFVDNVLLLIGTRRVVELIIPDKVSIWIPYITFGNGDTSNHDVVFSYRNEALATNVVFQRETVMAGTTEMMLPRFPLPSATDRALPTPLMLTGPGRFRIEDESNVSAATATMQVALAWLLSKFDSETSTPILASGSTV